MARWLVDGNNVMGSRPDGWWRDRRAAMQRVVNELDDRARATGDAIAERAAPGVTVVTSDRELRERVRAKGAQVVGARAALTANVEEGGL
jgi:rRNA-processing protein FCF1